jgi:hypothetical protein
MFNLYLKEKKMNKKTVRQTQKFIPDDGEDPIISQRLLQNIQQKLERSAALNGGFDKLLYKIDSIENNQNIIANKVDKIHDAIYDPDDGLFARITINKVDQNASISEVEKQVVEISSWKEQKEKLFEQNENNGEKFNLKINDIQNSLENLNKFKASTVGLGKWFLAAVGGGLITITFKVIYTFVILK